MKLKLSNKSPYNEALHSVPTSVESPFPTIRKDLFSLGVGPAGAIEWSPFHSPNLIVFGERESGKTTFLKNASAQAISFGWSVRVLTNNHDKASEWSGSPAHSVDSDVYSIHKTLLEIHETANARQKLIDESGVNVYLDLGEALQPILVVIDGLDDILTKHDEYDPLGIQGQIVNLTHGLIQYLMKFGKTVGIFVVASTETTDRVSGEFMHEFTVEVRLGGHVPSIACHKNREVPQISKALGRALIVFYNETTEAQTYGPPR